MFVSIYKSFFIDNAIQIKPNVLVKTQDLQHTCVSDCRRNFQTCASKTHVWM